MEIGVRNPFLLGQKSVFQSCPIFSRLPNYPLDFTPPVVDYFYGDCDIMIFVIYKKK